MRSYTIKQLEMEDEKMTFEELKNECEKLAQSCKGSEAIIFMMGDEDGIMHTCMGGDVATIISGINKMLERLCENIDKDYYDLLAMMAKTKTQIDIHKGKNDK